MHFIFLSKHNFFEHFSNKDLKLAIGSLIINWGNGNVYLDKNYNIFQSAFNNCARAQIVWKQLTHRNHLSLYKVITSFYDYYEVLNDDAQVLEISFYWWILWVFLHCYFVNIQIMLINTLQSYAWTQKFEENSELFWFIRVRYRKKVCTN